MRAPAAALTVLSALAIAACGGGHHHKATPRSAVASNAATQSAFKPAPAALSLANKLPLDRQVAQLFMVTLGGTDSGALQSLGPPDWGGVVFGPSNFKNDHQIAGLAKALRGSYRGDIAPLIAATQEGGPNTAIGDLPPKPQPAIGASNQPGLARSEAQSAGRRLRSLGFNMTLAPLADVDIPGGPLRGRLFGTDPAAVALFTSAAVHGYDQAGVISAVGHFPGSGAASADPDQMTATVGGSLEQLKTGDLIPFAAITPIAPVIMMSNALYAAFDGVTPAALLPQAVNLLRSYGFRGVVMTDDLDATLHPTGLGPGTVALQALGAGDDLLYISGSPSEQQSAYNAVLSSARSNPTVRAEVRGALLRVLTLKVRFGLMK